MLSPLRKIDFRHLAVFNNVAGLAEWTVPKGGMFVWVKVNGIEDVMELAREKCIAQGIFLIPGHAFNYDRSKPEQHIRLSYSYATPEQIDKVTLCFSFCFVRSSASNLTEIHIFISLLPGTRNSGKIDTRRHRGGNRKQIMIV